MHARISKSMRLTVAARSDIGRVRERNEDAVLVADLVAGEIFPGEATARFEVGDRGALLAVSDGMGGEKGGDVAAAMSLASVHRALADGFSRPDSERVAAAVQQANADVFAAGRRPSLAHMGATMTAVLVDGSTAYIAEVGDSRAYLLRGGELRQITRDQNFAQALLDAGLLTPEAARASPLRHVLVQAIGHTSTLKVAIGALALRQRDCLLLCSDGLTSKLTDDDVREVILAASTLDAACAALVAMANARGGEDNITAVLAGVNGDLPAATRDESISETYRVLCSFDQPVDSPASSRAAAAYDSRSGQ